MANNVTTTNKPATNSATNAKQALATATQPASNTFTGVAGGGTVAAVNAALWQWVNTVAGGNLAAVNIVTLPNVQANNPNPLPYTRMQPASGKRATIAWALVNGTPVPNAKPTRSLQAFLAYASKYGQSAKQPLDLIAALNGGFSPSAKTFGTAYVQLVYTPPATA